MCRCGMVKLMRLEYVPPRVVQIPSQEQLIRQQLRKKRILRLNNHKKTS